MFRPMMVAPAPPRMSSANGVLALTSPPSSPWLSRNALSGTSQSWSSSPPTPSGCSGDWSGPATKPSIDIVMFSFSLPIDPPSVDMLLRTARASEVIGQGEDVDEREEIRPRRPCPPERQLRRTQVNPRSGARGNRLSPRCCPGAVLPSRHGPQTRSRGAAADRGGRRLVRVSRGDAGSDGIPLPRARAVGVGTPPPALLACADGYADEFDHNAARAPPGSGSAKRARPTRRFHLLRWFRRQKPPTDERARTEDAPPAPTENVAPPPAEAGATDPARKKRRRGSRGGRNRKRPASGAAAAQKPEPAGEQAKQPKPAEAKNDDSRPERRPSQRKQRTTRRRTPPRRPPLPPAKRELLISVEVSEQRVAVLEDDKVAEAYLERPERRSIAGNIYKGSVDNVLPGMEAAFIEIGLEKNGFLYVDEVIAPELEGRSHGRKIQDLLSRGQDVLVQAVKDPMKSKGARLTTEISLPGRFVVFVPNGEGFGVSRRLDDDERTRLKDIVKAIKVKEGGVIVRTAAEGASADDIERDLVFLQRLWKTIEARANSAKSPSLVYQEAELPLRVIRDLFTEDFERAFVDHERTFKRVVGYLKKTSPHMADRVTRYREKTPLLESFGVDREIRSTLSRRVDLPSGGYLIFDYAEASTVIDVNTGRFVGSRGKSSAGRLEDTITKNNLEAVKEVVRQLRLRDIGGIIVIDFIDMANPKNRATVEEALKTELERDRTKTYVVEISPLGLVEMTRQNVTDGPREVMTRKCPTCGGDGVVLSD